MHRVALVLLVALCLVLRTARAARAAPLRADPVQFTYTRGPGAGSCPDGDFLRAAVIKEMEYDPFRPDATRHLTVTIERQGGEFRVDMRMIDDEEGLLWDISSIRSRGACGTLVEALGVSIAVRLDPDPVCPAPPEPVCPAPPKPVCPALPAPDAHSPAEDVPPDNPPVAKPDAAPHWPRAFLGAGALLAFQVPFGVSPGGTLFVGARWPNVSIAVEAKGLLPYTVGTDSTLVATGIVMAGGVFCGHLGILFGCGAVEAGSLWWRVLAGPPPYQPLAPYVLVTTEARAGVEVPVTSKFAIQGYANFIGELTPNYLVFSTYNGHGSKRLVEKTLFTTAVAGMITF